MHRREHETERARIVVPPDPTDLLTVHDIIARTRLSRPKIHRYLGPGNLLAQGGKDG